MTMRPWPVIRFPIRRNRSTYRSEKVESAPAASTNRIDGAPELYSELVTLSGDEGARRLVARYPAHGVEVDDPGVLVDVDTEADLEKVRLTHAAAATLSR